MAVTQTSPSAPTSKCGACQAGRFFTFSWHRAHRDDLRRSGALDLPDPTDFIFIELLRRGALYRCKACGRWWHLDIAEAIMSCVSDERVPLIRQWSEHPILLELRLIQKLNAIGRTPPDIHGNGIQFIETPCGVLTNSGERIDLAIVSQQSHAPFERWRSYRLGTEIADIYASPYALPLAVRIATSRAPEIKMSIAPTLIEMPTGKLLMLNWRTNFLIRNDCRAEDVKVSTQPLDIAYLPEEVAEPREVAYFVADP